MLHSVRPKGGDSHPVGSIPIGTVVSCIEKNSGQGARVAIAAGTSAIFTRKYVDEDGHVMCVLKMPSKREIAIRDNCLVTIGRMSNILHNKYLGTIDTYPLFHFQMLTHL